MIKCEVPGCDRELKTKSGYASHLRAHKRKGDITPEKARERKFRRLEAEIRHWRRMASHFETEAALADRICRVIRDSVTPIPLVEAPDLPDPEGAEKDETVVLFISDTHVGKLTPSYDFEVFGDRLKKLQASTLSIVNALRSIRPLKKLVLVFGGDKNLSPNFANSVKVSLR